MKAMIVSTRATIRALINKINPKIYKTNKLKNAILQVQIKSEFYSNNFFLNNFDLKVISSINLFLGIRNGHQKKRRKLNKSKILKIKLQQKIVLLSQPLILL